MYDRRDRRRSWAEAFRGGGRRRRKASPPSAAQILEQRTLLTAFVVDSLADGPPAADGLLTLREALEAANTNAASGDAAAGSADGDTIAFAAELFGTIALTNGELVIADDVEIDGEGEITVDAGGASRVFRVDTAAAAGVEIEVLLAGLRIVRGDVAGGTGGGLYVAAGGDVTLRGTAVAVSRAARGGGIYTAGRLVVELSVVRANVAADGGGIYVDGAATLEVLRSSVLGNAATGNALDATSGRGGGIFFSTDDGDPFILHNDLLVDWSYVSGNTASRAGGGIEIDRVEYARLQRSVLRGNVAGPAGSTTVGSGGALHVTDAVRDTDPERIQVHIYQMTVEGNAAGHQGGGLWNDLGNRMVVDGSILRGNVAAGDAENDLETHAHEGGGGGGGIFNAGSLLVYQSVVNDNVALHGGGGGLLSGGYLERVGAAHSTFYGTTVAGNSAARDGGGIGLALANLVLDRSAVRGNTAGSGGSASGSAPLGDGGGLHFRQVYSIVYRTDVRDNVAEGSGGGIWNDGYLIIQLSYIRSNTAAGDAADDGGGGMHNNNGFFRIEESVVSQNAADGRGGGIFTVGNHVVAFRTTIGENVAARSGGGVEVATGEFDVDRSLIYGNRAGAGSGGPGLRGDGGGLHVSGAGATVWVFLSRIRDNVAASGDAEGGGLWNQAGSKMTVERSTVSGNNAAGPGDGIFNNQGDLVLLDSILADEVLTGDSTSGAPA